MESTTSSLKFLTTQSLLGHARKGNNSAWKVILLRYEMTLLVAARRKLSCIDDAEDIVQTAFMEAVSSIESFEYRHESSFRNFLVKTVVNRCTDIIRSKRPRKSVDMVGIVDPNSILEDRARLDDMVCALDGLSPPLRDVILLRKFESKPWSEVAEVFEESERTVRRRYAEAVKLLKDHLSQA